MITDEMLRKAAQTADEVIIESLETMEEEKQSRAF